MECKSVEIVPHEQGWAILLGGVTTKVAPTRAIAASVAWELASDTERPTIWMLDSDGILRPHRSPTEMDRVRPIQTGTASPTEVIVTEPVAVPANIHGQDLRQMQETPVN